MKYQYTNLLAPLPLTRRGHRSELNVSPNEEELLYPHGRSIIMRNVKNPNIFSEVTKNRYEVTAASFSPSGCYIASGDIKGNVVVWATDNEEHTIKNEFQPIVGRVNGIAWDATSSRLATVGEGREKFGSVVLLNTQSSIGSISSHVKTVNSVAYSQDKPQFIATASDDYSVGLYVGTPFKLSKILNDHKMFVHCVKFSPDSKRFASCGADGTVNVYESAPESPKIATLLSPKTKEYASSLYCLAWSKDGSNIIASSASGHTYVWDLETEELINTLKGSGADDSSNQHVACLYLDDRIVTMSLTQEITYFDTKTGEPFHVIEGHRGPISSLFAGPDSKLYTTGAKGVICSWAPDQEELHFTRLPTNEAVADILDSVPTKTGIFFASNDDKVSYVDLESKSITWTVETPGRAQKLIYDHESDTCIAVVDEDSLCFIHDGSIAKCIKLPYCVTAISLSPNLEHIAMGSSNNTVRIYDYAGESGTYADPGKVRFSGTRYLITALEFSPNSKLLVVGESSGRLLVYDVETGNAVIKSWISHASRINCIKWSPDEKHVATSSLDTSIEIWSLESPKKHITIKPAHTGSVTGVIWASDNKIVSAGYDGTTKEWVIDF